MKENSQIIYLFLTNNLKVQGEAALWVVDEILGSLKDGNWHNLSDIEKKCSSYEISVQVILNFLSEHDFIEIDKESLKVKLRPSTLEFINEIQRIEGDMRALRLR